MTELSKDERIAELEEAVRIMTELMKFNERTDELRLLTDRLRERWLDKLNLSKNEQELTSNALACAAANAPRDIDPEPHGYLDSSVSADRYRFVALRIYANVDYFDRTYAAWCRWHKVDPVVFRDLESLE